MLSKMLVYSDVNAEDTRFEIVVPDSEDYVYLKVKDSRGINTLDLHFGKKQLVVLEELVAKLKGLPDGPKK